MLLLAAEDVGSTSLAYDLADCCEEDNILLVHPNRIIVVLWAHPIRDVSRDKNGKPCTLQAQTLVDQVFA
jgi:hypothetical protein